MTAQQQRQNKISHVSLDYECIARGRTLQASAGAWLETAVDHVEVCREELVADGLEHFNADQSVERLLAELLWRHAVVQEPQVRLQTRPPP